jgi:hypothetical protein
MIFGGEKQAVVAPGTGRKVYTRSVRDEKRRSEGTSEAYILLKWSRRWSSLAAKIQIVRER